jgi:hypothetical protein
MFESVIAKFNGFNLNGIKLKSNRNLDKMIFKYDIVHVETMNKFIQKFLFNEHDFNFNLDYKDGQYTLKIDSSCMDMHEQHILIDYLINEILEKSFYEHLVNLIDIWKTMQHTQTEINKYYIEELEANKHILLKDSHIKHLDSLICIEP